MRREIWGYLVCIGLVAAFLMWPEDQPGKKAPPAVAKPYTSQIGSGEKKVEPTAEVTPPLASVNGQPERRDVAPSQEVAPATPAPFSAARTAATDAVYVQGDSLSVDLGPKLKALLPGWQIELSAKSGRHITEGLALLRGAQLPGIVVWALGTNDYDSPASWQRAQIEKVLDRAGPKRCVAVATIWGDGKARASVNSSIASLARQYGPSRVQVIPWAEAVSAGRVRLADGTHPVDWSLRAALTAQAIQKCSQLRED